MKSDNPPPRIRPAEAMVFAVCLLGLAALLFPALLSQHHRSPRRSHCLNNLKNIALALQNYHDVYKMLPAGVSTLR